MLIVTTLLSSLATASEQVSDGSDNFIVKPVSYKRLVANLYLPKTSETNKSTDAHKPKVIIAFGGSEGGLHTGDSFGKMMAQQGIAVLGLAYFKSPGIAATLDQIPMEYFTDAVDYLSKEAAVSSASIGVVAGSRGSEAALLLATMDKRIQSVVVITPSNVAWQGMTRARSAWTVGGKDIPALVLALDDDAPLLSRFELAISNAQQKGEITKLEFPVEKINGPILIISARKDRVWPSFDMALAIERRLNKNDFAFSINHASYPTGHGFHKWYVTEINAMIIDHFKTSL